MKIYIYIFYILIFEEKNYCLICIILIELKGWYVNYIIKKYFLIKDISK